MNHEKALGGRFELPSYESTGFPDLRLTRLGYPSLTWADCVLIYNFLTFMHNKTICFAGMIMRISKILKKTTITPGGRFELPSYESNRSRICRLTRLGYPDMLGKFQPL